MFKVIVLLSLLFGFIVVYVGSVNHSNLNEKNITVDIKNRTLYNEATNVPSQCYTKIEDSNGTPHNPQKREP